MIFLILSSFLTGAASGSGGVILYGDMTTKKFKEFHEIAKHLAEEGLCTYVLRHYTRPKSQDKAKLSGMWCCAKMCSHITLKHHKFYRLIYAMHLFQSNFCF